MQKLTWLEINNSLEKTYTFDSFLGAIAFMQEASKSIDELNHHPEWMNIYNKVIVTLRTHDAGNTVTGLDYKLAEILDRLYENRQSIAIK